MKKNIIIIIFIFLLLICFASSARASLDYTFFLDKVINEPYRFAKTQDKVSIFITPDAMIQDEDLKYMMLEVSSMVLLLDSRQTVKYVVIDCTAVKEKYNKTATLDTQDLLGRFKGDISLAELLSRIAIITGMAESTSYIKQETTCPKELPVDEENITKIKERQAREAKAISLLEQAKNQNDLGYYSDAVNNLKEALDINLNLHDCYYELGFAYFKLRAYDNAADFTKKYISFKPQEKKGYTLFGDIYLQQELWQKAFTAYKSAAQNSDDLKKYMISPGKVSGGAINALEDYIFSHPDDNAALVKLALCYEAKGNFEKAAMVLKKALGNQ